MSEPESEVDWDLSWLLEEPDVAPEGLQRLYRLAGRRRRRRLVGLAAAATVVVVIAVSAGVAFSGRNSRVDRIDVSGNGPSAATALVVPGAPPAAAEGSTPLDVGLMRVWLPPSWTSSRPHQRCIHQGLVGDLTFAPADGSLTFAPCSAQTRPQLTIGSDVRPPPGAIRTRIDGIAVAEYRPSGRPYPFVVDVASLDVELTATTVRARQIVSTLQRSAAADVLAGPDHPAVPADWRRITYDGITFATPSSWPVHEPTVADCEVLGDFGAVVDLGNPTGILPDCPGYVPGGGADLVAYDGVEVLPGPATLPTGPITTTRRTGSVTVSATIPYGDPGSNLPPTLTAVVREPDRTLAFTLDVGPNPMIAADILGSIQPAGPEPVSPVVTGPEGNGVATGRILACSGVPEPGHPYSGGRVELLRGSIRYVQTGDQMRPVTPSAVARHEQVAVGAPYRFVVPAGHYVVRVNPLDAEGRPAGPPAEVDVTVAAGRTTSTDTPDDCR